MSAYLCSVKICVHIYIHIHINIFFVFVDSEGSVTCVAQIERLKIAWIVKNILGSSESQNSYHLTSKPLLEHSTSILMLRSPHQTRRHANCIE